MSELNSIKLSGGQDGLRSRLGAEVRSAHFPHTYDFIASNGCIDRYGEIVEPSGWELANYRKNPVVQNCHHYGDVLHTVGRALITEVRQVGDTPALYQRIEFASEVNPLAKVTEGLYGGGFLKALSVGFIPLEWTEGKQADGWSRKYTRQELLEVSVVGIPANPEALALGLKSGAIEKSDLRELAKIILPHASSGEWPVPAQELLLARALREVLKRS